MDAEQAIALADALVRAKTGKHLSDLQRLLLEVCWSEPRRRYDDIAGDCGYSVNYLKQDAGPKLWQLLSEICGEKVRKTNFRAALERLGQLHGTSRPAATIAPPTATEAIAPPATPASPSSQHWGEAPDVSIFYDRETELATLERWIVGDRCRLVAIVGMGGIGKTHLSVKLGERIQHQFEWTIWRSLAQAPPLEQLLTAILQCLTRGREIDLPASVDDQIPDLLDYFRNHRCLLILDNLETLLDDGGGAGYYRPGYENYANFLQRLGEGRHESTVVVTSRENPREISLMQGDTLPVRSLKMRGLSATAGQKLLRLKGCYCESEDQYNLLIEKYIGNPLALKMVAAAIKELFEGDISEFIKQNTFVVDVIRELLDQHFDRLSAEGKSLLYWLAIEREPISTADLHANIFPPLSKTQLIETLNSLVRRSLIEKSGHQFFLQPVVMEYVTRRSIDDICAEIDGGTFRCLNTHALLKARAKEYIIESQLNFILKPIADKLIATYKTPDRAIAHLKNLLAQLQEKSAPEPGYLAGNLLNLLCQFQTRWNDCDFSHLVIWQAYLQNVSLHRVNFANSDLSQSVFAEQLTNVLAIAFSPDGDLLATGDANGEIRLWQVADGTLLRSCRGHAGWVYSVAFSPDGKSLASGSSDRTVRLWEIEDGSCLAILADHEQRVRSVAFSPDGELLASGSEDRTVRLWDVETRSCLRVLEGHENYVWSVAFSPDGELLASGSEDRTVKLWDRATGDCLRTLDGHRKWVRSVVFSPDGKLLASASGDRAVRLWEVATGDCRRILEGHTQRVRSVVFSPDGKLLASGGGDHTIRLWNAIGGQCLQTLHGHSSRLGEVAFSPDGQFLASGGEDRAVRLWEVQTGRCLRTWQGYANWVQSVVFSPDGQLLASGSEDRTIHLLRRTEAGSWERGTEPILKGHKGWVCSVAFSPDGATLASASSDYSIKLWDVATGTCLRTLLGHTRWVRSVAFGGDGNTLVSGSGDYSIKLWDVATGTCLNTLLGHAGSVWSVAWSPDGATVASGSEDRTVRVWDVATGDCREILEGHRNWVQSVAFSPDGKTLASSSCDGTVQLWDVETGENRAVLTGHRSWVQSVAFGSDGKRLASGSCDGTVKIWDAETETCLHTLTGHRSWVWSVAFTPDGSHVASGSQDETIRLWDVTAGDCVATLGSNRPYEGMCIRDTQGLTEAQRMTLKALGAVD